MVNLLFYRQKKHWKFEFSLKTENQKLFQLVEGKFNFLFICAVKILQYFEGSWSSHEKQWLQKQQNFLLELSDEFL